MAECRNVTGGGGAEAEALFTKKKPFTNGAVTTSTSASVFDVSILMLRCGPTCGDAGDAQAARSIILLTPLFIL